MACLFFSSSNLNPDELKACLGWLSSSGVRTVSSEKQNMPIKIWNSLLTSNFVV